jgi:GDP-4-dehydro-6-deoxy-D-mannose reductase
VVPVVAAPRAALVTGAGGFVGRHLLAHLSAEGDGPLWGLTRPNPAEAALPVAVRLLQTDLLDREAVRADLAEARPGLVYHLAAQASVPESHDDPWGTLANNIGAQVNLLEAVRQLEPPARVLVVGSSEEYGRVRSDELPLSESAQLRPLSPYAVSKVTQDLLGYQYAAAYGLPIVRVRPFTHLGPGQDARFAASAFARQIARIEAGLQPPVLAVGNLDAERDLTDARDIVRAYRLALLQGEPGEVYNVGSGRTVSIRVLLDGLLALSACAIRVEVDPGRFRPVESAAQIADCRRLQARTGWRPLIPLQQTLADLLEDWRQRVAARGPEA